jgi:site-specific recombinase XerD
MKSGHSIRDIQLFLGHKKLETTALYLASAELDDAEVHSLTDAAFESVH